MANTSSGDSGKINPIEVQKYLSGIEYPADKQAIVDIAREQGADDQILSALEQLPDEQFETPADVSKGIGQVNNG